MYGNITSSLMLALFFRRAAHTHYLFLSSTLLCAFLLDCCASIALGIFLLFVGIFFVFLLFLLFFQLLFAATDAAAMQCRRVRCH